MMQDGSIEKVRHMIEEADNIVALLGVGTYIESGGENLWSSRECYRIEDIYHKSPDEMWSVGFYSARRDKFFEFYKNEIIDKELEPASLYYDLKTLQDEGKLKTIITQNMHGLHYKAGLKNVIELHGNIHNNYCPHCGKSFDLQYIKNSVNVPLCDECGTAVRPGICLFGENIANNLMTEAVNACEKADLILTLGTNLYDNMVKFCTGSYTSSRIVLITKEEHYSDKYADVVIHDEVSNVLPLVIH